jgi:DNA-binding NtrC family response regulator
MIATPHRKQKSFVEVNCAALPEMFLMHLAKLKDADKATKAAAEEARGKVT